MHIKVKLSFKLKFILNITNPLVLLIFTYLMCREIDVRMVNKVIAYSLMVLNVVLYSVIYTSPEMSAQHCITIQNQNLSPLSYEYEKLFWISNVLLKYNES